MKQHLINEFLHEAENTRKLLKSIPDTALAWKPSEKNWTTAQLASHIAGIYDLYEAVINQSELDMATYKYDKGDISKASNIVSKFEENFEKAKSAMENYDESKAMENWTFKRGEHIIIPPSPRIGVMRNLLFNHVYHHRGELISYLRSTGNKVPGLYGPTADDAR